MYPALVVAEAMLDRCPAAEFVFAGSVGGFERPLVEKSVLPIAAYHEIQAGPLHGINPLKAITSAAKLAVGTLQALRIMRGRRPNAVLSTGGWVSFPVTLAAWLARVPVLIFLPDIEPALSIKVLRPFAAKVAITMPESKAYFRADQTVVTGYPLRKALLNATREAGVAHFKLDPARRTVLVFGGSTGARNINVALIDLMPQLAARSDVQVIHVIGERDWERAQEQLASVQFDRAHYHPFVYLHDEMGMALAAADIVINRSGASVLGELPYFGLPSILVPYPYAWRYQKVNADALVSRGAALLVADERMQDDLLMTITGLLDNPAQLDNMRTSAKALAQPDASGQIAAVLLQLAGGDAA